MGSTITNDRALKRVTFGFAGGLTVSRRMTDEHLAGLKEALETGASWHELRTEQEVLMVSLALLAYFEADETGRRIGFD